MSRTPNPIPISRALELRAQQFGFRVKGGVVTTGVAIGMHAVPVPAQRLPHRHIECPYCHAPLEVYGGTFCRMVGCVDPRQSVAVANEPVLLEVTTGGIDMGACFACEQVFFVPSEVVEGSIV